MNRRRGAPRPEIDLSEFARLRGELEGGGEPADFPRLLDLLADGQGSLAWHLRGERRTRPDGGTETCLLLHLEGRVRPRCIRCLEPVEVRLDESRVFRVTASESQAERFDAEHDESDALVADPRFDVLGLVEDEAILALPIAPRHPVCGLPAKMPEAPIEARENPFQVLAGLRRSKPGAEDA